MYRRSDTTVCRYYTITIFRSRRLGARESPLAANRWRRAQHPQVEAHNVHAGISDEASAAVYVTAYNDK